MQGKTWLPHCHTKHKMTTTRCETFLENALTKNIYVKFVLEKMKTEHGCELDPVTAFKCRPCGNETRIGHYDPSKGEIELCADNIEKFNLPSDHVERTVLHELIHAFDDCRADFRREDCSHIACTEVRAASLSGDCDYITELRRRNFAVKGQGARCVRRRAELSLASAQEGKCAPSAKEVVDAVFDKCYADTAPFARKL